MDVADERMRSVILPLASTGWRVGAMHLLKLPNLEKVESEYDIYKISVYEGFNEEYVTFCTPEYKKAIDDYLTMLSKYSEKLTQGSLSIREQFDIRDSFSISRCRQIKPKTLTKKLIDLAERSVIREKEILVDNSHNKRAQIRKMFQSHMVFASSLQFN